MRINFQKTCIHPKRVVPINFKNVPVYKMNTYLLFKSLHLIAVISWMAGLLYLPRIFVYHSENTNETITTVFKIMKRKLFYYIMTPAMTLSWLIGLLLISEIGFDQLSNLWLQLKLILVIYCNQKNVVDNNYEYVIKNHRLINKFYYLLMLSFLVTTLPSTVRFTKYIPFAMLAVLIVTP